MNKLQFACALVLSVLATAIAGRVDAQMACIPVESVDQLHLEKFGERGLFRGVVSDGAELRVYLNPKSGEWSLVVLPPETPGVACLMATGEGGEPYRPDARPPVKDKPL